MAGSLLSSIQNFAGGSINSVSDFVKDQLGFGDSSQNFELKIVNYLPFTFP
jgi:hypothetical protein